VDEAHPHAHVIRQALHGDAPLHVAPRERWSKSFSRYHIVSQFIK
jgi:hypothetical protein